MAIRVHLASLPLPATVTLSAQTPSAPAQTLIGQGRGVDHVGIGVRDFAQTQHDYEQLGFKVSKGGHFSGGVSNSAVLPWSTASQAALVISPRAPQACFGEGRMPLTWPPSKKRTKGTLRPP